MSNIRFCALCIHMIAKPDKLAECLARAAEERNLAGAATLDNVRERHLRAAQTWEDLAGRTKFIAEAQSKVRERDEVRSVAAEGGSKGGRKRAENVASQQRSEIASRAAAKRWGKPTEGVDG